MITLLVALMLAAPSARIVPIHIESVPYPHMSRVAQAQGDISLVLHLDTNGNVASIEEQGDRRLTMFITETVKKWTFSADSPSTIMLKFRFRLLGEPSPDVLPSTFSYDVQEGIVTITNRPFECDHCKTGTKIK